MIWRDVETVLIALVTPYSDITAPPIEFAEAGTPDDRLRTRHPTATIALRVRMRRADARTVASAGRALEYALRVAYGRRDDGHFDPDFDISVMRWLDKKEKKS